MADPCNRAHSLGSRGDFAGLLIDLFAGTGGYSSRAPGANSSAASGSSERVHLAPSFDSQRLLGIVALLLAAIAQGLLLQLPQPAPGDNASKLQPHPCTWDDPEEAICSGLCPLPHLKLNDRYGALVALMQGCRLMIEPHDKDDR